MKTEKIKEVLHKIKKKYRYIYQITETANFGSDPNMCLKFIEKRNCLLAEIMAEQRRLSEMDKNWHDLCVTNEKLNKTLKEIGSFIAMIIAIDSVMQKRLSKRIYTVKNKISNLNSSSKMALSYARNTVNRRIT